MSDLEEYRAYAKRRCGELAQARNRVEALEQAALRTLKAVGDCASDDDAAKLFAGAKLLGFAGQEKEALDSILELWELVRPAESPVAEEEGKRVFSSTPQPLIGGPYTNEKGNRCGLCDGWDKHEHPRFRCSRCGNEGLQENWEAHAAICKTRNP